VQFRQHNLESGQAAGNDLASSSDEVILSALLAGSHHALAVLFDRYGRLVLSIARRILHDDGEAEEVMQTVLLDVFCSAAKFDPERACFKVWLMQFAYHRSLRRKHQLQANHFYDSEKIEDVVNELMRAHPRKIFSLLPQESRRLAEEALATLEEKQRRILELTYYEGLTAEEISRKTGDSVVSIRHHLYRSLAKLRVEIERPRAEARSGPSDEVRLKPGGEANVRARAL
jgi:RNA polymerase sigma-70 factor (ECF subfamily)